MILTILGNNGPYPTVNGATSSYLLKTDDNKKIIFDMGSGAFSNLLKNDNPSDIDAIIVSHLHYDHIADLGVLSYYLQSHKSKKIQLLFPEKTFFTQDFENKGVFDVKYYSSSDVFFMGDTKITFKRTNHPVLTYSSMVEENGKRFLYTGDTNYFAEIEDLFSVCDSALCDSCFLRENGDLLRPHMSVKKVCELGEKYKVKVILTHLNPEISEIEIKNEAFGNYIISHVNECYKI